MNVHIFAFFEKTAVQRNLRWGGDMDELITFLVVIIKNFLENKYLPNSGNNSIERNVKSDKCEKKFGE